MSSIFTGWDAKNSVEFLDSIQKQKNELASLGVSGKKGLRKIGNFTRFYQYIFCREQQTKSKEVIPRIIKLFEFIELNPDLMKGRDQAIKLLCNRIESSTNRKKKPYILKEQEQIIFNKIKNPQEEAVKTTPPQPEVVTTTAPEPEKEKTVQPRRPPPPPPRTKLMQAPTQPKTNVSAPPKKDKEDSLKSKSDEIKQFGGFVIERDNKDEVWQGLEPGQFVIWRSGSEENTARLISKTSATTSVDLEDIYTIKIDAHFSKNLAKIVEEIKNEVEPAAKKEKPVKASSKATQATKPHHDTQSDDPLQSKASEIKEQRGVIISPVDKARIWQKLNPGEFVIWRSRKNANQAILMPKILGKLMEETEQHEIEIDADFKNNLLKLIAEIFKGEKFVSAQTTDKAIVKAGDLDLMSYAAEIARLGDPDLIDPMTLKTSKKTADELLVQLKSAKGDSKNEELDRLIKELEKFLDAAKIRNEFFEKRRKMMAEVRKTDK